MSLLTGVGYALVGPFLSLFLIKELDAGPVAVSAFLLASGVAALVVGTLVGRLSDARAVRRNLMVLGAVAGAVSYGLFAVLRDYWLLLVVSLSLTAVASSLMPQMFAYARQSLERTGSPRAPLVISTLRTMVSVSWVGGPPLAALLIDFSGFTGLFGVSAVVYLAGAVVTVALLPELGGDAEQARPAVDRAGPRREMLLAACAFVLLQGATAVGVLAMPLYVTDVLHGTTADAGLVLGVCAALEIPLMLGFGALAMRVDHRRLVLAGGVVALAYYGVMLVTQTTWQVAAAQALHAVVISAVMGVGISYFQDLAPDRPGYATTLYTNTAKVSAMLSGPLLGLAQVIGYRGAYAIGLVLSALGLALLLLARRR
ncbi:sugar efflux transporter [Saccharothrix australiensis]|uniref:SET family sugar efflux transporter-like MFS transporter n=1 Tax=Saccharothrix australiensis TaxID=2072 RepID=A0A495W1T1_9PSEU|nr:sugar efflux transporter [Saccharothrix australiensis]RKT55080.1 SET family sugar efflux transporter-like MFS transporter [Saccharothrix australiensis]